MKASPRIVVVGGSAAGPKAAARAKRLDQNAHVLMIQKEPELSMASCGYPYYVGGLFEDRDQLLRTTAGELRDPAFFAASKGVAALVGTEAIAIDRAAKTVRCRCLKSGQESVAAYDRLILCTGASPRRPNVPGADLAGVSALHSLRDADFLRQESLALSGNAGRAVVVGGGLIGIETCEALVERGLTVTVVERLPRILSFLDPELALFIERRLRAKGVTLFTGVGLKAFRGENGHVVAALLDNGTELPCGLAVVAVGAAPNVSLAREAGLTIGPTGGIAVNEHLRASDPSIYAAGDCIEVKHRLTGAPTLAPFGHLANLEGRVAGENAVLGDLGPRAVFPGTIHSCICKIFDHAAGAAGLTEHAARAAGFDVVTALNAGPDKPGFMGGKLLVTKMVAERASGRILGVQCIGQGEVNRQMGQAAMAILAGFTVSDLATADLPYAPPFSLAVDNLIVTAHILENKLLGRMEGVSSLRLKEQLEAGETPFLLDTRLPEEYQGMRLGLGETLLPLGELRARLDLLPQDKTREIVCFCKVSLRGYEAQRILNALGWDNVKVMEGGVMAWPFARAK